MAATTLSVEQTVGPLSPSQHGELAAAHSRAQKIRRAAAVAAFNGWAIAIFAALSAPFALFGLPALMLTIGMAVVAYYEFTGRRRLLQFDPQAATLLGWNQIGLLALIAGYCLWMLTSGLTGEGPFAAELRAKPELGAVFDSVGEMDHLYRLTIGVFYGTVIVVSGCFQGLNAWYYFSRRRHIEDYRAETPDWVLELQQFTLRD